MESVTSLMLSLKPLDSVSKIHRLIAEIKAAGGVITKGDKIAIYLKIINLDAKKMWLEKSQKELTILPSTNQVIVKNEPPKEKTIQSIGKKQKHRKSAKAKAEIGNRMIDPNSSDYHSQLLKANLRNTFEGYVHGLSDW